MQRHLSQPRNNFQQKLAAVGFNFYQDGKGNPYWNEAAHYRFTSQQIDEIEMATDQLQALYIQATEIIIEQGWWGRLHVPNWQVEALVLSWKRKEFSLYGRFDLAYDGVNPPKLLEYNADTPTSLLEAAVVQWYWLQDLYPKADQFNSLHERLISTWQQLPGSHVHFSNLASEEDNANTLYLQDTCTQAGKQVTHLPIERIGWNERARQFRDERDESIDILFKLYPWEWALSDPFGQNIPRSSTQFIEPLWKSLWSNKGMLAILWELFPDHPYLLPTYFTPGLLSSFARKPFWSREGCNVTLIKDHLLLERQAGPYGEELTIDQAYFPLPDFGGYHPILGSWVVGCRACGMGIRESRHRITNNRSQFVPHLFLPEK